MEKVPRTNQDLTTEIVYLRRLVDQAQRRHSRRAVWDEDLFQDVFTLLLVQNVVGKFWEKWGEDDISPVVVDSTETAALMGVSRLTFLKMFWHDQKKHPDLTPPVRDKDGVKLTPSPEEKAIRYYFLQSDVVNWVAECHPDNPVNFPVISTSSSGEPDLTKWRGYLCRSVLNILRNIYRDRSRHHKELPGNCFATLLNDEGDFDMDFFLRTNHTPEMDAIYREDLSWAVTEIEKCVPQPLGLAELLSLRKDNLIKVQDFNYIREKVLG